ncbi:NYN domain-containing protein [Patescibacteria group bacterium]|nr:NYN domain-containing protein [Patescibacteria group bacterium]
MENEIRKNIIYVFIDSQNLNLGIKEQGWELDFKIFFKYLKTKFKVKKIFLFLGYLEKNRKLYIFLEKVGYIIIYKPIIINNKIIKGNCDAELVLYSMIEYKNYNKVIIISGDGDFYCLIKYLKNKNKLYKIIIPNKNKLSFLLVEFKEDIIYLNNLKTKLEKIK